jgi:predicted CXXCH cytochrome family protein
MRFHCFRLALLLAFITAAYAQTSSPKYTTDWLKSYGKYVEITGATRVGADVCATCHAEDSTAYRHAFHAQQGVECEDCHGNGSLHVEGGGDKSKIVSFPQRSPRDANGVCLGCHARDAQVRHWTDSSHAVNRIRCTDCHQIHSKNFQAVAERNNAVDTTTRGRSTMVEAVTPESSIAFRPRAQTNEACLKCHQTQRAESSLPYHHPIREGKMTCVDCHDPHGGATGKNLKTANINELCLSCHAQYRGPFMYQHPPVNENCMLCHVVHGSPNTNLLNVSEPALCLQCHSGHHNGAGLPLPDRCTNCHGSIHGTDVATPSGGSRFVDKGPYGLPSNPAQPVVPSAMHASAHAAMQASLPAPLASHAATFGLSGEALGGASGLAALGALPQVSGGTQGTSDAGLTNSYSAYSITPGAYQFLDLTGFGGRVGEYNSLQQSVGAEAETAYVSVRNHTTLVTRGDVLTGDDYRFAAQLTISKWLTAGFDTRSFVQQQDNYPFYAFPVMDIPPGSNTPLDTTTLLIPSHTTFAVTRRMGNAYARFKVPKIPVHLFVTGDWQARSGVTQLSYLDENATPAIYDNGVNTTCGQLCHYTSQYQSVNYTTRNIGGGADIDLGPVRLTYQHQFSSFNDRLTFPTGTYTGPFTPQNEGFSIINPPPVGPAPLDVAVGNYYLDIPSPNQASSDRLNLSWTASPRLNFNGNVSYIRLSNTFTNNPQNTFNTDETLNWRPIDHLRVTATYHQNNLINNFTPYYSLYGNMSYHDHSEGVKLDYELPAGFDVDAYYRRSGITRSNSSLWPQIYSINNTDLMGVVPSSFSNTTGMALRYHDHSGSWSARAGYEWTGTHDPGYLIVPQSNNRIFGDVTYSPASWLSFTNDLSILVQNAFPAIPLPNTPGNFQRRNRLYTETASAALRFMPGWYVGLGYSYQENSLTTYMAFQNDSGVGYLIDEPAVPYKQISQTYWGESTYTIKQRLGLNLRLTYNSASSGMRPDVNPNDAALLGNQALIQQGAFDPGGLFPAALGNVQFAATQVSQVIVPQWIGQAKVYYLFPRKFEGGLIFYYGSYRDYWNPDLNGVLRTFNVYVGRSW